MGRLRISRTAPTNALASRHAGLKFSRHFVEMASAPQNQTPGEWYRVRQVVLLAENRAGSFPGLAKVGFRK